MGEANRISNAMFLAAVTTLNGVGVIRNRLAGRLINYLQSVCEMHWHR